MVDQIRNEPASYLNVPVGVEMACQHTYGETMVVASMQSCIMDGWMNLPGSSTVAVLRVPRPEEPHILESDLEITSCCG